MDIADIEYLCAAHSCGSYSEAAFRLSVSYDVVSKHILKIEKEIGATVFERAVKNRPLALTPIGEQLIGEFSAIRDARRRIDEIVSASAAPASEALTIGYSHSVSSKEETAILSAFARKNPEIPLIFDPRNHTDELISRLSSGLIDGIFLRTLSVSESRINRILKDSRYEIIEIARDDTLRLGFSDKHPLASRDVIRRADFPLLKNEVFIFKASSNLDARNRSLTHIADFFGIGPNIRTILIDLTNPAPAFDLVRCGIGILPQAGVSRISIPGVRFVPVEGWNILSKLLFVSLSETPPPHLVKFRRCVREFAAEAGSSGFYAV